MPDIIGKIYSASEANKNYGSVLSSVELSSSQILSLCGQTSKYIMFNIKDGKLSILGDNRTPLYPIGFAVDASEVYVVYSKSIVEELLKSGKADTIIIEQRKDVISLTNGQQTLEMGGWCPPICG